MLDTRRINTTLLTSIPSHVSVMDRPNPTALRKAIKNPVEIANMKQAHLADGIALTRFMYWLKTQVGSQPITERSAAAQLEAFRRACPLYLQPSFDPILAAGPHSAIVHYSATPESDRAVTGQGFLPVSYTHLESRFLNWKQRRQRKQIALQKIRRLR